MRIYLGPFQWRERISSKTGLPFPVGIFGWRMPVGATQAFDFRGPQGIESIDAFSPAKALFVCPDSILLIAPFEQIASDPLEMLSRARQQALKNIFNVTTSVSVRFIDLLHELSTGHTDLSGAVTSPPRIASTDGKINHVINDLVVKSVEVGPGMLEWAGVMARHQAEYRSIRLLGLPELHRKYLGTLARKYRLSDVQVVDAFIPLDLPREDPITPTTVLTESFSGTTTTFGGDNTWTEVVGDWQNFSGAGGLATISTTSSARCEGVLSTSDMRGTYTLTVEGSTPYGGPSVRFAAAANTHYNHNSSRSINDYYCTKYVTGTGTDIIVSELSGSITLPTTDKIEVNGDQVQIWAGASSRGTATDTAITGGIRAGMGHFHGSTSTRFDTWIGEDLVAAEIDQVFHQTVYRGREIGR